MSRVDLGSTIPDVRGNSTHGEISLHEYFGDSWGVLFSHPADYTPVCSTELVSVQEKMDEFTSRNVKVAAISCQDVESHHGWVTDMEEGLGHRVSYPIIADPTRDIAESLGMLDALNKDQQGLPLTVRSVFIVDPNKVVKIIIKYPASTGRNFTEIIRVIDSLQLASNHALATPANWEVGQEGMVMPSFTDEEAEERYGELRVVDVPSGKRYLRFANAPSEEGKDA